MIIEDKLGSVRGIVHSPRVRGTELGYDVAGRNVRLGEPRLVGTCAMALRPATAAPTAAASHLNPTTLLGDTRVQPIRAVGKAN
jgi:hypothetical protein